MTAAEAIKSGQCTLIDVREAYELEIDGSVKTAINIPMGEISEHIQEIEAYPKPIIVFCRGGNRATSVSDFLKEHGIENCMCGGGYEDIMNILES
ncbi:MAG: rhodanese-like domain-containing protein [Weeksellaceae bacterium]